MMALGHTARALLGKLRDTNGNLELAPNKRGYLVRPWSGGAGYWFPDWVVCEVRNLGLVDDDHINERGISALQEDR